MQTVPFVDRQIKNLLVRSENWEITPEKESYLKTQSLIPSSSDQGNTNTTNTASDTGNGLRRSKRLKDKKSQNNENIMGKKRKRPYDDQDDTTQNKKRKVNNEELCTWTGSYSELDAHIKTCPVQLTKCKYCNVKISR
eukprot:44199_1